MTEHSFNPNETLGRLLVRVMQMVKFYLHPRQAALRTMTADPPKKMPWIAAAP